VVISVLFIITFQVLFQRCGICIDVRHSYSDDMFLCDSHSCKTAYVFVFIVKLFVLTASGDAGTKIWCGAVRRCKEGS
jgi:hypothetical protein